MKRRQFLSLSAGVAAASAIPATWSDGVLAEGLPTEITALSASDLSLAIRQKKVSCVEVMRAYLSRIHRYNPVYNSIVSLQDDDQLLAQARVADEELAKGNYRGWMHGMPHAVKDLTAVAGIRFTSGSPIFAERIAEEDDPLPARIRQQGAIFIGKTNTPEFGLGCQTYNPVFGATASAWNPRLTSGGSSGGAASALGTHLLPVADGGDMMGSLRNPGAFNNVIGFRPSTSVLMDEPGGERSLWTSGPMGRDTADAIRLLQTLAPSKDFANLNPAELKTVRVGWLGNPRNHLQFEPGVLDLCEKGLETSAASGVHVTPASLNMAMSDLWQSWTALRHHRRLGMLDWYENPETKNLLKPEVVYEIEQGMALTEMEIAQAQTIRLRWYAELDRLFEQYDFLVLPTAQVFPFDKTIHWPKEINGQKMDSYHRWMEVVVPGSLAGIPVVNLPVGFDAEGRPMGMQVMGKFGEDRKVLEFALAWEKITEHLTARPDLIDE